MTSRTSCHPERAWAAMRAKVVLYTTAGVFYGVLTEVLATLVFKAPMRSSSAS